MKNKIIKLLIIVMIFCAINGHAVLAVKKAIFPDGKLLQPMPNAYFIHPNISGNINSTTNVLPNQEPASNTTNTKNDANTGQTNGKDNGNPWIFYIISSLIFLLIIGYCLKLNRAVKSSISQKNQLPRQ